MDVYKSSPKILSKTRPAQQSDLVLCIPHKAKRPDCADWRFFEKFVESEL